MEGTSATISLVREPTAQTIAPAYGFCSPLWNGFGTVSQTNIAVPSRGVENTPSALWRIVNSRSPDAHDLLSSTPDLMAVANRVAAIIAEVLAEGAPFTWIDLNVSVDPESPDWKELVFSVAVRADWDNVWKWWKRIGEKIGVLSQYCTPHERSILSGSIGVHLVPNL